VSHKPPFPGILTPWDLQAGQEFTDRDAQLPADRNLAPAEMGRENSLSEALKVAPDGDPYIEADVRAVYDSRPILGYDFNITVEQGSVGTAATWTLGFAVPLGYVAVVLNVQHWTAPLLALDRQDLTATLKINGGTVPNNSPIYVGAESTELMNYFVVADESQVVAVTFDRAAPATITFGSAFAMFHGNLIRKTGKAAPAEVGNPAHFAPNRSLRRKQAGEA